MRSIISSGSSTEDDVDESTAATAETEEFTPSTLVESSGGVCGVADLPTSAHGTTAATAASSAPAPPPLTMTAAPRFDTIGVHVTEPQYQRRMTSLATGGGGGGSSRATTAPTHAACFQKLQTTQVCITLQAADDDALLVPGKTHRTPVDMVVVLDCSESMRGPKFALCQSTLQVLLRQLSPHDRFGLVTYNYDAQVAVPIQKMTPAHRQAASQMIQRLQVTMGGTNISAGIIAAARELAKTTINPHNYKEQPQQHEGSFANSSSSSSSSGGGGSNPVQTVFFLTDGRANQGIRSMEGLLSLVKDSFHTFYHHQLFPRFPRPSTAPVPNACASTSRTSCVLPPAAAAAQAPHPKRRTAVSLHTFGYGVGHNGTLLREMASATEGGSYHFIQEDQDVGMAFGDALGGILSMVAQSATVTLRVPPAARAMGVQIRQVHQDDQDVCRRRQDDGSDYYTVTLGDFYSEESRDLVVTLQLAMPPSDGTTSAGENVADHRDHDHDPIPHLEASLSYTSTLESKLVQGNTAVVSIARPAGSNSLSPENAHVAAQVFRVHATHEMQAAERLASAGRFHEAKSTISSLKRTYLEHCSSAVQAMPYSTDLFSDANEMEACMDNVALYRTRGQATLNSKLRSHKMQRLSLSSSASASSRASAVTFPPAAPTSMNANTTAAGPRGEMIPSYKLSKKRAAYASRFSNNNTNS